MSHAFDGIDPVARGRAHGETWRERIAEHVALRRDAVAARTGASSDAIAREAAVLADLVEAVAPDVAHELRGIAEGAGIDRATVALLQGPAEVVAKLAAEPVEIEGSASIYIRAEGGAVLGIAWASDLPVGPCGATLGGPHPMVVLGPPGTLGLCGANARGLAIAGNATHGAVVPPGLPWPVALRQLLLAPDAPAACDAARALDFGGARQVICADGSDYLGIEIAAGIPVLTQTGAKAAHLHTNHLFDPVLRTHERVPRPSRTFDRLNLATTLYAQGRPTTPQALWDLLWELAETIDGAPSSTLCRPGVMMLFPGAAEVWWGQQKPTGRAQLPGGGR